jgi:hypothetical protein
MHDVGHGPRRTSPRNERYRRRYVISGSSGLPLDATRFGIEATEHAGALTSVPDWWRAGDGSNNHRGQARGAALEAEAAGTTSH